MAARLALIAERSDSPSFRGNAHQTVVIREDADNYYCDSLQSDAKNLQYPKYAWKILQEQPTTLADFVGHKLNLYLDKAKFTYSSYPYSCGLGEAWKELKKFVWPEKVLVMVNKENQELRIQLDPLPGTRKRKKLILKFWQN